MRAYLDLETRIEWVELVMSIFARACDDSGYDTDTAHWMGAAVREAVTNGMRHGNRMDRTRRLRVRIETPAGGRPLEVSVEDEGEGFDADAVPDPLREENLLKESGRGIFFMRQFMDEVDWKRVPGGGTRVILRKHAPRGDAR